MAKIKASGTAGRAAGLKKAARRVKDKTVKAAADHPVIAEVVAATLVAAAAALKNPAKAKALAASAADEIKAAGKGGKSGGAMWALALDIARRSVDSLAAEAKPPKPPKASKPPKPPKPKTAAGKKKKKAA